MGPHGAGLSNVVFTEPMNSFGIKTKRRKALIEFNIAEVIQLKAYSRIALISGMRYYGLLFGNVDHLSFFGFNVVISEVIATLDKALKYVNRGDKIGDNSFFHLVGEWRGRIDGNFDVNAPINL